MYYGRFILILLHDATTNTYYMLLVDSAAALLPREGSSPSLSQCDHQHLIEATPSVASSFNPLTHTPHA